MSGIKTFISVDGESNPEKREEIGVGHSEWWRGVGVIIHNMVSGKEFNVIWQSFPKMLHP